MEVQFENFFNVRQVKTTNKTSTYINNAIKNSEMTRAY